MGEFIRLTAATLLGALISFGTTFYFERRKEQRTERQEAQNRERQLRQGLRLVCAELIEVGATIDVALESKQWWSSPPRDLPQSLWIEYCPTLAALLEESAWDDVRLAHCEITDLNGLIAMGREGKETFDDRAGRNREPIDGNTMSEIWQAHLNRSRNAVDRAIETLLPIVEPD